MPSEPLPAQETSRLSEDSELGLRAGELRRLGVVLKRIPTELLLLLVEKPVVTCH